MACCAFAVFLLVNLLAPLGFLRRRRPSNAAVAWRYGEAATTVATQPSTHRPTRWRAAAGAVVVLELALVVGAGLYLLPLTPSAAASADAEWDAFAALHTSWCRTVRPDSTVQLSLGD
jgi:hypothetical protein